VFLPGVVCSPFDCSEDGCCTRSPTRFAFERFDCRFCRLLQENFFACSVYEPCVSCCMSPRNLLLRTRSKRVAASNPGYEWLGELDAFDYCAFACLTNSHSVHFDKSYRFPVTPYGFGELAV
jgi:SREBP regulating gene protein